MEGNNSTLRVNTYRMEGISMNSQMERRENPGCIAGAIFDGANIDLYHRQNRERYSRQGLGISYKVEDGLFSLENGR